MNIQSRSIPRRARLAFMALMFVLFLVVLAGCRNLPPVSSWCPEEEMEGSVAITPGTLETFFLDTTVPAFSWAYTGECEPSHFRVIVSRYPDSLYPTILENIERPPSRSTWVGEAGETGPIYSWEPGISLEAGHIYYWAVQAVSGLNKGALSPWEAFKIGPRCVEVAGPFEPVQLYRPSDGAALGAEDPIDFMWSDPNPCLMRGYRLEVSARASFPDSETSSFPDPATGVLIYEWSHMETYGFVDVCTSTHYWRVKSFAREADVRADSPVAVSPVFTYSIPAPASCGAPTPPVEPMPLVTLGPTGTPTNAPPLATAIEDAACLLGADWRFETVDYLMQGASSPIVGRHPQGTWWVIRRPDQGGNCWIRADKVEATGDLTRLPVMQPPPLPTETPVLGCWVYNQQQQPVCTAPCPADPVPGGECTP